MGNELATKDEITALIGTVTHKGMKAGAESIARMHTLVAYQKNRDAVSEFAEYVDCDGNASTSPKGIMIQINKRIKDTFGRTVEEMGGFELNVLSMIRMTIPKIIEEGRRNFESRSQIKARCYRAIDSIYKSTMDI